MSDSSDSWLNHDAAQDEDPDIMGNRSAARGFAPNSAGRSSSHQEDIVVAATNDSPSGMSVVLDEVSMSSNHSDSRATPFQGNLVFADLERRQLIRRSKVLVVALLFIVVVLTQVITYRHDQRAMAMMMMIMGDGDDKEDSTPIDSVDREQDGVGNMGGDAPNGGIPGIPVGTDPPIDDGHADEDHSELQRALQLQANSIVDSIQSELKILAIKLLLRENSQIIQEQNDGPSSSSYPPTFPFVTMATFEQDAQDILDLIHVEPHPQDILNDDALDGSDSFALPTTVVPPSFVTFVPFVDTSAADNERSEWQFYARRNQFWIQKGLQYQHAREQGGNADVLFPLAAVPASIFFFNESSGITEPYPTSSSTSLDPPSNTTFAPIWQIAPAPLFPAMVNYDLLSQHEFATAIHAMTSAAGPVLSPMTVLPNLTATHSESQQESWQDKQDIIYQSNDTTWQGHDDSGVPHLAMMHPIFSDNSMSLAGPSHAVGFVMSYHSVPDLVMIIVRSLVHEMSNATLPLLQNGSGGSIMVEVAPAQNDTRCGDQGFRFQVKNGTWTTVEAGNSVDRLHEHVSFEITIQPDHPNPSAMPDSTSCTYDVRMSFENEHRSTGTAQTRSRSIADDGDSSEKSKEITSDTAEIDMNPMTMYTMTRNIIILTAVFVILFCIVHECWVQERLRYEKQYDTNADATQHPAIHRIRYHHVIERTISWLPPRLQYKLRRALYNSVYKTPMHDVPYGTGEERCDTLFADEEQTIIFGRKHASRDASTSTCSESPHPIPPSVAFQKHAHQWATDKRCMEATDGNEKFYCSVLHGQLTGFNEFSCNMLDQLELVERIQNDIQIIAQSMEDVRFHMDLSNRSLIAVAGLTSFDGFQSNASKPPSGPATFPPPPLCSPPNNSASSNDHNRSTKNNNATRLCSFANASIARVSEIMTEGETAYAFDGSMGGATGMSLRVGIHSGVLKTSSCLSTDDLNVCDETMKVAYGLEQTGMPGKIHVSSTTSTELILQGKEHWLTPNDEHDSSCGDCDGGGSMASKTHWADPTIPRKRRIRYGSSMVQRPYLPRPGHASPPPSPPSPMTQSGGDDSPKDSLLTRPKSFRKIIPRGTVG